MRVARVSKYMADPISGPPAKGHNSGMQRDVALPEPRPPQARSTPFRVAPIRTSRTRAGRPNGRPVPLLDRDPELARRLPPDELPCARSAAVAATVSVPVGPWVADMIEPHPAHLGYLVLDGVISRELQVAGGRSLELLGAGDVARPWQEDSASFCTSRYHAVAPVRLAVLDEAFAERIAPWPQVSALLLERALRRSRCLAAISAVGHVVGLEQRLVALFWCLAERWGRMSNGGVSIDLPLTHQMIADLIGAQRPSVTTALGRLSSAGTLRRTDGVWDLRGDPPPVDLDRAGVRSDG